MASTIGIVVIFIIMCALMYTKKLSAFFALPLMAFFIALVSGIPFTDSADKTPGILTLLFVEGPVRLASAMMILIFGAILAQFVKNTGIAEETVRKVSELAGDRPLVLGISFFYDIRRFGFGDYDRKYCFAYYGFRWNKSAHLCMYFINLVKYWRYI